MARTHSRLGGLPISSREPRVNDKIRAREVRLVDPDGGQVGIKSLEEAMWLADQLGLDLVEVAPDARPPVCRLMDYGKYKYEQSVKAREARKNQTRTVIKEVQFRPKIGKADFDVKQKRVVRFLNDGDKVKATMRFRGREVSHPEIGREILRTLADNVSEHGEIEVMPRLEGRQMTMVIAPLKRKTQKESRPEPEAEEATATEAPSAPAEEPDATPEPAPAEPVAEVASEDVAADEAKPEAG